MPALMRSELPELARTRHHWIVLIRPPHRPAAVALLALLLLAAIWPWPWAVILVITLAVAMLFRLQTWHAELIILTRKRIVRMQGVPETTTSEASLRIERVFGARLVQTVPGKILGYATIELEAPGEHPAVRRLRKIAAPHQFYGELRAMIFGDSKQADSKQADSKQADSNERPSEYTTEPLPRIPKPPPAAGSE